ncbi:MAG: hypothetical protein JHC33_08520 [Ignisphaera sp.]|nr:hypothetical protein [Ignisphaera sp.]
MMLGKKINRRNSVKKKQTKESTMYGRHEDIYDYDSFIISPLQAKGVSPKTNTLKITDTKSSKHFGILLSTQQAVEEFQKKSGMDHAFTTEYQFHYWALVARVRIADEVLDIGIPTVLFNYQQKVNGAAVDFHLNDVEEASKRNAPIAEAIAGVLIASDFGKYLVEIFNNNVEWINVPMNTCHVHPGQLSSFSGTDYSKTVTDPGICFPLSEPQEQPSFSSIICHDVANGNIGKVVRTEYRCATRNDMSIDYKHGTCFAYWRDNRVVQVPLIQSIFTMKQNYTVPSYINVDGTVVLTENKILNDIVNEFNKFTDWSPNTEDVKAERIVKQALGSHYLNQSYKPKPISKATNQLPFITDSYNDNLTLPEIRTNLIKNGYSYSQVYDWDETKCTEMYKRLVAAMEEAEPKPKVKKSSSTITTDMSIEEQIKFMLANGVSLENIKGASVAEIYDMFEDLLALLEEEEGLLATVKKEEEEKVAILLEAGYSISSIDMLSDYQKTAITEKLKDEKEYYENCTD